MKTCPLMFAGLVLAFGVSAQNWSDAQLEVWEFISASWVDDVEETGEWPDSYAAEGFTNWGEDVALPMGIEEAARYTRFGDASSQTVYHRTQPITITIDGDTAVANYYATVTSEDKDGKRSTETTGITETLVKRDGEWKFLSTAGWGPEL